MNHVPVLLQEVLQVLDPKSGEFFIDGTLGGGGHAEAILEKIGSDGKLLAIDWDREAVEQFEKQGTGSRGQGTVISVNDNYANLKQIMTERNLGKADGLLLDLGFSSDQVVRGRGRGFSFQNDEPLLMTYSDEFTPVRDILKRMSERELAGVIKEYGEERYAGRVAKAIVEGGRKKSIETTGELVAIISNALPRNYEHGRIHPATRTFMALRIYANHELENLTKVMNDFPKFLKAGARAAIISFHSLEDRLVKQQFKEYTKEGKATLLTKKPISPTLEERADNVKSRSAKLRTIQMI